VFERTGRVNIDLDNIESIKVLKGGASYLFGDDALAGAVIITTKRGAKQAGYRVDAEGGSYGYTKGLVQAGIAGDNGSGYLQLSGRQADGYHDDSAYSADYANGKWQSYLSATSDLTFGFENALRTKNSHGTVRGVTAAETDPRSTDPAYNDYANHYNVDLGKYYLTYANDLGSHSNLMLNGYMFTDHTNFYSSPVKGTSDYNYLNDYQQVQRGVKGEYRSGGEGMAWLVGTDLRANSYDNTVTVIDNTGVWGSPAVGSLSNDNLTDEQVQALYGEMKFRISQPMTLTLNGRQDHIALDYNDALDSSDSGAKNFDVSSWRVGANYAARDNLDYYANLSTGFRAPSASQLFVGSNSPTTKVAANPDLKPEHSLNTELGMRRKDQWGGLPVELDMALFQMQQIDHIQATAGQYTTSGTNTYDNVGDMRQRGLEVSLRSDRTRRWSWDVAYTLLDATYTRYDEFNLQTCTTVSYGRCTAWSTQVFDNAGNKIPRVPDNHLNLLLRYKPSAQWTVIGEMNAISDYYADEINRVKIDGHQSYNLLVNYDLRNRGKQEWSVFVRVDNLLDSQYYNNARGFYDANYDGVYDAEDISITVNPGRVWTVGFNGSF
jgi:iron complex outermembrane receptor protein